MTVAKSANRNADDKLCCEMGRKIPLRKWLSAVENTAQLQSAHHHYASIYIRNWIGVSHWRLLGKGQERLKNTWQGIGITMCPSRLSQAASR